MLVAAGILGMLIAGPALADSRTIKNGAGTDSSLSRLHQVFTSTSAPVQILHGTNDSTVPVSNAIELDSILTAAKSPHEFIQYAGAEHRFDHAGGDSNEAAAADAWQHTLSFLSGSLRK
jgi:dienelactone hydrolase